MAGTSKCRCGQPGLGSEFSSSLCRTVGVSPANRRSPAPSAAPSKPVFGSSQHLPGLPVSAVLRGRWAMTQNIYDNEEFFAGYSRLRRSVEGLGGAPEWPTLRALLPDLQGRKVVDLGCGFGWFCSWARQQGAAHVLGIDVSERMLARSRDAAPDPAITYTRTDMEQLELPAGAFDLVYSSLALHYVENLSGLLSQAYRSLIPGGASVFSVEHPIFTAPAEPSWSLNAGGRKIWPIDGYLDEGPRSTDLLAKG